MENIMNFGILTGFVAATVVAVATFTASAAHAQSGEVTRTQVRAELAQLRGAGYDQSQGEDAYYPAAIEAAQARTETADTDPNNPASSYGGGPNSGSSASGALRAMPLEDNDGTQSIYFGQ
jgi:hypothetical protein